jgi:hypothetical protein
MSEPAQGAKDPHPALATIQNALPQAFDTAAEKWLAGPHVAASSLGDNASELGGPGGLLVHLRDHLAAEFNRLLGGTPAQPAAQGQAQDQAEDPGATA